jgi:phosphatidylinositol alpha-mannosyltransferase
MAHLKIGMVLDESLDAPDGVQQYILALGSWLSGQGHEVHYLVGETVRTDIANVHSLSRNLKVRFNGNRLSIPLPTSRKKLRSFLKAEAFDVLHVQMPHSPWLAQRLVLAADDDVAIVSTFHVLPYSKMVAQLTKGLAVWTRASVRRFDEIFSVSQAAADYAARTYGVTSTVIPNMIDYPLFHSATPSAVIADPKKTTILYLGRLVPRKGCGLLLEALNILNKQRDLNDCQVIICSKGPLLAALEKYCDDYGLTKLVRFTGFVDEADKPSYYAAADISVFPSRAGESFGIVLLEAMASGKAAVLAGDNPGYRSVMDAQPELLFDPTNATLLAQKIAMLIDDKNARYDFAAWGERYAAGFDRQIVGSRILTRYQSALRKRRET